MPPKVGSSARDRADHLLDLGRVDLDVEDVDAGELLEQDGLAFHHRLGGQRADIAQAEHRGAVGDDRDEVLAGGELGGFRGIVDDRLAGGGDAGRIGQRQVALVAERLGRLDLELTGPGLAVIDERARAQIVRESAFHSARSSPQSECCWSRESPYGVKRSGCLNWQRVAGEGATPG